MIDIINGLDRKKFSVYVVVFSKKSISDKSLIFKLSSLGCKLNFITNFKDAITLKKHYKSSDIFHAHCIRSLFFFLVNRFKNTVVTSHCIPKNDWPLEKGLVLGSLIAAAHTLMIKKTSHVVSISKDMQQYFSSRHLILNGVDVHKFKYSPDIKIEYDYVFCGRLIERKQPAKFIEFIRSNPSLKGVILGDGPYRSIISSIVAENNLNIDMPGNVDNPEYYYKRSNAYFSSSLSEGMPLSVLEAACCGCILHLSDIPPHNEIIDLIKTTDLPHHYLNGNSDIPLPSSSAIEKSLRAENASEVFSSKSMSNKYESIYKSMNS